jgi:hypothetical protein
VAGSLGVGGDGGSSGEAAQTREGAGGGGGLYGGGGGGGVLDGAVGGGGGGSSLVPTGGTLAQVSLTEPPSVVISTHPLPQGRSNANCLGNNISDLASTYGGIKAIAQAFSVGVKQVIEALMGYCAGPS